MAKYVKGEKKYWENEKGETIEFGNSFMRCFDQAGKLQFGTKYRDSNTGETVYAVKFVLDRDALFEGDAASFLRGTIDDWEELIEEQRHDD